MKQVWVIAGGAGTLGQALVERVIARGDECIVIDKDQAKLFALSDQMIEGSGQAPYLYPMDLVGATLQDLMDLRDSIQTTVGQINHVVHAAGFFKAMRPLMHQPAEEWLGLTQLGIHAPLFLTQQLMGLFTADGPRSITWVIDSAPLSQPAHWGGYGMVQQARLWQTQALAKELGPKGPKVIAFMPESFYSPITAQVWPARSLPDYADVGEVANQLMHEIFVDQRNIED